MKTRKRLMIARWAAAICAAGVMSTSALADTVAPDKVKIVDGAIKQSLTGAPGNAKSGKKVFSGRKLGNCLACHKNKDMKDLPFHGEVGPSLDGVAGRWQPGELRAIIVDPKKSLNEETIMPAFYYIHDKTGFRVTKKFLGKTILSAQQVEDLVAYLMTLKEE